VAGASGPERTNEDIQDLAAQPAIVVRLELSRLVRARAFVRSYDHDRRDGGQRRGTIGHW
jgi:hypothetical protein